MEIKNAILALSALAQETRLSVFRLLVQAGPTGLSVGAIADEVKSAPATLSFHLKEMVHAGLLESRQEGRFIFYSANYICMNDLLAYLTENCCVRDGADCAPACADLAAKAKPEARARSAKRRASAR